MTHTVLIALHALSGAVCFGFGLLALRRGQTHRRAALAVYLAALLAMTGFVAAVVALSWAGLGTATRLIYAGLGVLAAVMVGQAIAAWRGVEQPSAAFVGHVGFTLVSLFDAFVIVSALDLGAPSWLVVVGAVAGAVTGHLLIRRRQRDMGEPAPALAAGRLR